MEGSGRGVEQWITRSAAALALIAVAVLVREMKERHLPAWATKVAGTPWLAEAVVGVLVFVLAYIMLLVVLKGLINGEHPTKFSLKDLGVEWSSDVPGLKEIDLRLTRDMKELNDLVQALVKRVDDLDPRQDRSLFARLRGR